MPVPHAPPFNDCRLRAGSCVAHGALTGDRHLHVMLRAELALLPGPVGETAVPRPTLVGVVERLPEQDERGLVSFRRVEASGVNGEDPGGRIPLLYREVVKRPGPTCVLGLD